MICRACGADVRLLMIDLGVTPSANAYLTPQAAERERRYPLRVRVCEECWLAQTEDFAGREELFGEEYAYFSSFSPSWLAHARQFVEDAVARFGLSAASHVVEVAANDGYLLQYVKDRGIPCSGIEPTANTASAARAKGLTIVEEFFGAGLADSFVDRFGPADLTVANNVLAHVPDINDFVSGFPKILKPRGVACFEFPHLLRLVEEGQFDTIYHEHFSYLSLTSVRRLFARHGLEVFRVEQLATHGGSLRVFAQRAASGGRSVEESVSEVIEAEERSGIRTEQFYRSLGVRANDIRRALLGFLGEARAQGRRVVGYGAAAKGNTLLNYAGVTREQIDWVIDRNPVKQGKLLPGSLIPVVDEGRLSLERPDYVLILPWNLKGEIMDQLSYVREWGARFVWAVPELVVT